jgi:hypothetical protein
MFATNDTLDQMYSAQLRDSGVKSWRESLTVHRMLDFYEAKFELSGPFKCSPAWKKKGSRLIESAMMNLFIPEIYLRRMVGDDKRRPHYQVVDGKQRFLTLAFFYAEGNPWYVNDPFDEVDGFRLSGCRRMPILNGLRFGDFTEAMKVAFANYDLGAIVVEGRDDAAVSETFKLLSQHTVPMNAEQMGKRLKRWNIRTPASVAKPELEVRDSEVLTSLA